MGRGEDKISSLPYFKMTDRILKAILFFIPIAYYPNIAPLKFELLFFQISSILLFMACLIDTPKRQFNIGKPVVIYLAICLFSVIINNYDLWSMTVLFNIFLGCIDIFIIITYAQDLQRCFRWLGYGIILNSIVYIWQLFGYHPIMAQVGHYGGLVGNAPRFSFLIALAIPFLPLWYLLPLFILGIFLKKTCVFFSIACVIAYKLYKSDWRKLPVKVSYSLFFISIVTALLIFRDKFLYSFNYRLSFWKDAITYILQSPVKGYGLGNFKPEHTFNSFLQWIHGVGLLGAGFIGFIAFIIIRLKKIKWYLLPLIFLCTMEYVFEVPRLWFLIICIIAYYAIEIKEEVELC